MLFHKLDKNGIMIYLIKSLGQVNSAKISGTASGNPLINNGAYCVNGMTTANVLLEPKLVITEGSK